MIKEAQNDTTSFRRRPRNNNGNILSCEKNSSVTGCIIRRTMTTKRKTTTTTTTTTAMRKELWVFMTLLISCWAIQMAQAASLLNGRYETTTDVTDYLNLAYDASNMIESDDHELILDIYKNVSSTSLSPSVPRISVVAVILFWVSSMKKKTFYGMSRNRITSLEQNLHVVFFCFGFFGFLFAILTSVLF